MSEIWECTDVVNAGCGISFILAKSDESPGTTFATMCEPKDLELLESDGSILARPTITVHLTAEQTHSVCHMAAAYWSTDVALQKRVANG
jgi:hypothetical protein